MLIKNGSHLYCYAITRDLGFAPNPFHGFCTLATCKPDIRKSANVDDWVMGIGGSNVHAARRKCVFLMKVSEKMSFQEYWNDHRFSLKKPARNGSGVQMIGDNIYHKNGNGSWIQEDSHHSNPDGTQNMENLIRDTGRCDQVLISQFFLYFGSAAIDVDLESIGYGRIRNIKKIPLTNLNAGKDLITLVCNENIGKINYIVSDPCHFSDSHRRVNQVTGKII